ncbi:hypothetical protein MMC08_006591 [Hypocenomyce scalaris]|nr:hypothetical protein [Hypocenomyce scalaris]
MGKLYERTRKSVDSGDFSALADLHSTSSGLKSLCTSLAADGIETCRRALGGHGFGGGSGLIQLNNDYLSKPTVEGDNWMITQQAAAYLIKKATTAIESPDSNATDGTDKILKDYLKAQKYSDKVNKYDVLHNDQAIVDAFERRAADLSFKAYEERIIKKRSWNSLLIQLHKLSRAQSQAVLVSNFHAALTSYTTLSPVTKSVLWDLFRLFSLHTMDLEAREFYNSNGVSNTQLDALPSRIQDLMASLRPHAVKLVDSWMVPDYLLDSALGRYDGKVYEDLFHRAHRLNPLNRVTFNPRYWEEEIVMGSGDGGKGVLSKL